MSLNLNNDFVSKRLGELCNFTQGVQIADKDTIKELKDGYIRYIYIRDLFTDKFPVYVKDEYPNKILAENDIVMVNTGNTSGSVYKAKLGVLCNNAFKISIKNEAENVLSHEFLWVYLNSDVREKMLKRLFNPAGQPHVGHKNVSMLSIQLPPIQEQKKIAEILSTWDKAIETVEKLVANSQQQKKALMQQLLTGQKRLLDKNGLRFSDEWKFYKANELFQPVSKKNNSEDEELLAVTQDQGVLPRSLLERRVVMPEGSTKSYKLVESGNFIISLRSFQGGLEYSNYRGLVSPAYTVLEPIKTISNDFFKHYFKSYNFIGHLAVAVIGIRDGKQISYEDFSFLKLPYPTIKEQKKIAQVLTLADREIDLYQQQLDKLKLEKKALMQQLLTGQKRVIID